MSFVVNKSGVNTEYEVPDRRYFNNRDLGPSPFGAGVHPKEKLTVYDDAGQGIAFEFAGDTSPNSLCIAIMVHPPGKVNFTTAKDVDEILRANGIKP